MPDLLKNMYSPTFFDGLVSILEEVIPGFEKKHFLKRVFSAEWENLELKQRMRHICLVLQELLPGDYSVALPFVLAIKEKAQETMWRDSFAFMFLPDYVEQQGVNHFELSVQALEVLTSFTSAEFAVRPFLINYPEKMMTTMLKWSTHPNVHVRRLASEGCRTRLPWAMAVPFLKKDPAGILPILENLMLDSSAYVRRSVANNLNDLSKDHPDVVLGFVKKWRDSKPETTKLLKHACRTLLKQGNFEALQIFGFERNDALYDAQLILDKQSYRVGENVAFSFTCHTERRLHARMQYVIEFAKSSSRQSRKIFFLAEKHMEPTSKLFLTRRFKLQHYSTRKLYAGIHRITIMLNGTEMANAEFDLTN